MSNRKGTLTSRTLEKLGFVTSKFRSNSSSDDLTQKEANAGSDKPQPTVNTITGGELDLPEKTQKKTLLEKLWGPKHGNEESSSSKSTFYVDSDQEAIVTLATGGTESTAQPTVTPIMLDKKKKVQPEGTFEYTVTDTDTIEKIAARFDTTPSELKKLNKLISSMIFPCQLIFVPDKDYVLVRTSSVTESDKQKSPTLVETTSERPTMDIPLVKSANVPPAKVPGHVERQIATGSQLNGLDFEVIPHKLTDNEAAEMLDKECMERFIKLSVKHITDGQGVVKGVLLVTPNAVMFDPDVMDPLVIEHGAEKYGMIAPMDIVISAAMYHDIAAMKIRNKRQVDGALYSKPVVYHDPNCPIHKHIPMDMPDSTVKDITKLPEDIQSKLEKSLSVCSCGGEDEVFDGVKVPNDRIEELSSELNKGRFPDSEDLDVLKDAKMGGFVTVDSGGTKESDLHNNNTGTESSETGTKPKLKSGKGKRLSVSFSLPETDEPNLSDKVKSGPGLIAEESEIVDTTNKTGHLDTSLTKEKNVGEGECITDTQSVESSAKKDEDADSAISVDDRDDLDTEISGMVDSVQNGDNNKPDSKESDESIKMEDRTISDKMDTPDGDKETRIGNIVYLPVEEDPEGVITVKSIEHTQNTLYKLSGDEFKNIPTSSTTSSPTGLSASNKGNTDGDGVVSMKSSSGDIEPSTTSEPDSTTTPSFATTATSALGPFSPTPHINAFVNYATGFFQRHGSDSTGSVHDIQDMQGSKLQEDVRSRSADIPTVGVTHVERRRTGKLSRNQNLADIEVESAVRLDEKSELFTMDYKSFAPKKSIHYPDPPLYLCLRLGTPQKTVFHNYSIESYGKRRKKSEYWFSIPRDKVDHLYAFFVQWTPEIYGDEDELTAEKRGFIVIDDDENEDGSLDMLDEHFGPDSEFHKDWEIISKIEAERRRSIVYHEPLPLPDLIGESVILNDEKISKLSQIMPGRTVGYPWTLVYSTDTHGFSLKTLFREMNNLESPILLAVKDINDKVFGALTSCELKLSDSFYGTGETFLYTFHPEFKVFHWTGENNFFMKGNNESLSIGAGQGLFGLWFDGDIYHGRTNRCETFDNDILTLSEDFIVKAVEAWAFIWD